MADGSSDAPDLNFSICGRKTCVATCVVSQWFLAVERRREVNSRPFMELTVCDRKLHQRYVSTSAPGRGTFLIQYPVLLRWEGGSAEHREANACGFGKCNGRLQGQPLPDLQFGSCVSASTIGIQHSMLNVQYLSCVRITR